MDLGLRGKVAVIAGGARGIGRAIAEGFAREGARVGVLDREETTPEVAEEIARESGASAVGVRCDIVELPAVEGARDSLLERLGGVDHLVVAAGVGSGEYGFPFLEVPPSAWGRVLEVNVVGAVHLLHAFAPRLIEKGEGSVTVISSVAALFGSPTDPPYSASKAALNNFAQCAARDLAPHRVRVNTICPGMVKTALNRSVWEAWSRRRPPGERLPYEEWADEKVARVVPLGRWQEPEDVANLALFLASRCARNITGQTMNVDGGYVMR